MIWGGADTQFYFFYKNAKINLVDKKLRSIFAGGLVGGLEYQVGSELKFTS
jgi:hypothetical protein